MIALVSIWRWRAQLLGNATGSPALLLPTSGPRQVAIGTDAPTSGNNLFVLNPDGSLAMSTKVSAGIAGDVVVGSEAGLMYLVSPKTAGGTLSIVPVPGSGSGVSTCAPPNTNFGYSPVIASVAGKEVAVVAASNHTSTGNNLFVFQNNAACPLGSATLVQSGDFTGATALSGTVFLSHSQGFTSIDQSGNGFSLASAASISPTVAATLAPPSLITGTVNAIFGSGDADHKVYRTVKSGCGLLGGTPCWVTDATFNDANAGKATSGLPATPIFDGNYIWAADDQGRLYRWSQTTGAPSAGWPVALNGTVSGPLLLQDGSLLAVDSDGTVRVVSPAGVSLALVDVHQVVASPFVGTPVTPAVDASPTLGGVAYVPAPQGWVFAVQVPAKPAAASPTVWPRPARDSCNSRFAGSPCQ
jgi:hypothetical protein